MKPVLVPVTLAALFALAACEKPAVVAVPTPAPVAVPVPVPGPAGPQGEAGKPGQTNIIVAPAASAASK